MTSAGDLMVLQRGISTMRTGCRISSLVPSGLAVESVSDSVDLIILTVRSEVGTTNCPLFVCEVPHCRRRIFAERFGDDVVPLRSRRTARLECIVHHLGLALGGRPAASFAKRLMLPVSNDTLLRVVRRRTCPRSEPLVVAGIDD
jgi:hypothetical protein